MPFWRLRGPGVLQSRRQSLSALIGQSTVQPDGRIERTILAGKSRQGSRRQVALIRQIQRKDGLSESLRRRLSELMIAMGVEPEPTDTTPAAE